MDEGICHRRVFGRRNGERSGSPAGDAARLCSTTDRKVPTSRTSFAGVYDLSWDPAGNRWWLVRVHD